MVTPTSGTWGRRASPSEERLGGSLGFFFEYSFDIPWERLNALPECTATQCGADAHRAVQLSWHLWLRRRAQHREAKREVLIATNANAYLVASAQKTIMTQARWLHGPTIHS